MNDLELVLLHKLGKGGGETSDYRQLSNLPSINGTTLIGNKTLSELGINWIWRGTRQQYEAAAATISPNTFVDIIDEPDMDNVPTQGSSNPVTSDGVFNSLARLDTTTGDIYFGQTRVARVMDYDSYAALTTKENIYYLTYPTPSQNSGRSLQTSPLTENENSDGEDIRTETDESEMR